MIPEFFAAVHNWFYSLSFVHYTVFTNKLIWLTQIAIPIVSRGIFKLFIRFSFFDQCLVYSHFSRDCPVPELDRTQ